MAKFIVQRQAVAIRHISFSYTFSHSSNYPTPHCQEAPNGQQGAISKYRNPYA